MICNAMYKLPEVGQSGFDFSDNGDFETRRSGNAQVAHCSEHSLIGDGLNTDKIPTVESKIMNSKEAV